MNLQRLLLIHAIVTFAAGVLLIVAPAVIPQSIDIHLRSNAYLLSYFLGAAELAIAYLSFFGRKIKDKQALRIVSTTFILFHAITGILELYEFVQGSTPKIIANIVLRVAITILFYYYGIYKTNGQTDAG